MKKLENDTRGFELSYKFIQKSDNDIATIARLVEYANKTGNTMVVTGGYATEALCGGMITRPHGDVDVYFILDEGKLIEESNNQILKIISDEKTKWTIHERNPKRIDYVENDDKKEFFEKRRVEVHIVFKNESNLTFTKRKLIDSKGEEVEVFVIDLAQTVKEKIHKFYELRNGIDTSKDRHSSKSDYYDLKRLLGQKELNREEIRKSAPEEYDFVISLLSDIQK